MHPIIFETSYFSIKAYGLFVAMGFLAGLGFALREARQQGLDAQPILDLAFYIILSAIIGSRLFYVLTNLDSYRHNLLDILKVWQGGLTFFGGLMLSFAAGVIYMKRHRMAVWKTFDLFAPALALGDFFGPHRLLFCRLLLRPGMQLSLGRHLHRSAEPCTDWRCPAPDAALCSVCLACHVSAAVGLEQQENL